MVVSQFRPEPDFPDRGLLSRAVPGSRAPGHAEPVSRCGVAGVCLVVQPSVHGPATAARFARVVCGRNGPFPQSCGSISFSGDFVLPPTLSSRLQRSFCSIFFPSIVRSSPNGASPGSNRPRRSSRRSFGCRPGMAGGAHEETGPRAVLQPDQSSTSRLVRGFFRAGSSRSSDCSEAAASFYPWLYVDTIVPSGPATASALPGGGLSCGKPVCSGGSLSG